MTPKVFGYHADAYNDKMKQQRDLEEMKLKNSEYIAWLNGLYVRMAVASILGGRRAPKYPERPLTDHSDELSEIAKANGRNEDEMKAELLAMQMMVRDTNARLDKVYTELDKGQTDE